MTDIATLGLEIRSDGVVVASQRLQQMTKDGKAAEGATSKLSSATSQLTGYLKAAAAAFGLYKLAEYAKEAALLAARYQTLGVVMNTVGATAGYTNAQMAGFEKSLQKQGIAMVESRQVLTQMAQAHLDLAKSSELARVAQDAATIGGINSSEAFERMVSGIQKGETEILKTIGINVNFEQSYVKIAATLGKSRDALSETEKSTARMNAVLERGKDIAGVYDAAMGTAGKQLTSMKRYMDNLKVTLGSVFNDALILAVQAFTGGLKEANTEAEKLTEQNKLSEWGRDIVTVMAVVADGFTIVKNVAMTAIQTIIAGAMQLYYALEAASFALIGDFKGAKQSMQEVASYGEAWSAIVSEQWKDPIDKYQQAAKSMYAARDASKAVEEQKRKEMEAKGMATGTKGREVEEAEQLALIVKKNRDQWASIVVEQLESVGAYSEASAKQIELNKLTDDYKTMLNAASKSKEAASAVAAQELLNQQSLTAAKRKELDMSTDHEKIMLNIESSKLAAKGYSQDAIYLENGYKQALLDEQVLQNQITTEINPRRKTQMQEQLEAQQQVNRLVKEEVEQRQKAGDATKSQSKSLVDEYNSSITISRSRDEQYKYDQSILHGQGNVDLFRFYGPVWTQFIENQAKQRIAEYDQLKRQERLVEEQKRTIESVGKASDELASAAVELANSGRTLADSLRSASRNITSAQVDIAGGAASVLSPEQQYQLAQSMFINTANQAQSTGDVELFNALPELAKQFMEASQGYFASGTQFAADYATVQAILGESSVSASSYADSTQTVVDLLGTQNEILTAIKAALETGGDTASLLSQLNTVNGQIKSATENVNTSVGGVTTAAYAINNTTGSVNTSVGGVLASTGQLNTKTTDVNSWLLTLNGTTGGVTTATTSGTNSVTSWLSSVRDQTANTATFTAATKNRLDASMLGSQLPGRISGSTTTPLYSGQTIDRGSTTTYTYFAKGGIAYEPSIFGEAGPEAAVPLPDGRSIPVTLSRSDNYGDTSALLVELRSLRADVNQLRQESVGELREIKSPLRRAVAGR